MRLVLYLPMSVTRFSCIMAQKAGALAGYRVMCKTAKRAFQYAGLRRGV